MSVADYLLLAVIAAGITALTAVNAVILHFGLHAAWEGAWNGGALLLCLEFPLILCGLIFAQARPK